MKNESIDNTVDQLRRNNYTLMLRRETSCIYSYELNEWIFPDKFSVDAAYYFEVANRPDESRMLYAITLYHGYKGFLIDTCDVYMDNISRELLHKLKSNRKTIKSNPSDSKALRIPSVSLELSSL